MNELALENFISFCDEMEIAEENQMKNGVSEKIHNFLNKIKHAIKRMLYSFLKFKKIKASKKRASNANAVTKAYGKILDDTNAEAKKSDFNTSEFHYEKYMSQIEQVESSPQYKCVFEAADDEPIEINSSSIIAKIKSLDKSLENWENTLYKFNDEKASKISNLYIKLYSGAIRVYLQLYNSCKGIDETSGKVVNLSEYKENENK